MVRGILPYAIFVNSSGYVFVTGSCAYSAETGNDYFTIKYNSSGVFNWVNTYTGPNSGDDRPSSITADINI